MANKKLNSKKQLLKFENELNDLLSKYDLLPEDGKLHLMTSKMSYAANSFKKCKPECLMRKKVELPDGTIRIITWCDPICQDEQN